jgi:repressor LexA
MSTKMKTDLTEKQQQILDFIEQFRDLNGYPPTLREIGKHFQIASTFGVKRHLDALAKKGALTVESNASRGIALVRNSNKPEIISDNENFHRIPIVGRVAAGYPVLAIENIEGSVNIDTSFLKRAENCFALRVKGDSMINAGIHEGDIIIVSPQNNANNGEIVVALVDDDATVKRYEKTSDNQIVLIPENENYSNIIVTEENNFSLLGKVVGVLRWLN